MDDKPFTQTAELERFFYPMFANCVHVLPIFVHVSERDFFHQLLQTCRRMHLKY